MMASYPTNELPLEDLLRYAAEHRVTAAIDLRSDLTAGRIDIVRGQIVDALFGGLTCEEAVYAAICSDTLHVNRGRAPNPHAVHRVLLSTGQIVEEGLKRRERPTPSHVGVVPPSGPSVQTTGKRPRLRLSLFGSGLALLTLSLTAAVAYWLPAAAKTGALVPPPGHSQSAVPPRAASGIEPVQIEPGTQVSSPLRVDALVDETGEVIGARFDETRDERTALEDAAYRNLRRARFVPGRLGSHNVVSWTSVTVPLARAASAGKPQEELAQLVPSGERRE